MLNFIKWILILKLNIHYEPEGHEKVLEMGRTGPKGLRISSRYFKNRPKNTKEILGKKS